MKKWLNTIFGSSEDSSNVRKLEHPRDLQIGDIVKFRYLPQKELSNEQFEITQINTYDYKDRNFTEFVLWGDSRNSLFMAVDETGDETFLSISKKITRDVVEQLFDLDEFSLLFDDESNNEIHPISEPAAMLGWMGKQYIQEVYAERGYFHKGDYRNKQIPQAADEGDDFDYYMAIDNTRKYVVEAEVYDGGETDVIISVRLPIDSIEEMWPKANG